MYKRPIICIDTGEVCYNYADYLASKHWRNLKSRVRSVKTNQFCFICKRTNHLHVHHKTYDRLGNEHTSELMYLCETCHQNVHDRINRPGRKKEKLYNTARILRREYLRIRRI